jgi:hypothetical protein
MRQVLGLTIAALVVTGCNVGDGEGWFTGRLWVDNCKGGESIGTQSAPGEYDLDADFFAAQPMEDSSESSIQRRNNLIVRVQPTSNNLEVSDGVLLQFVDLDRAAQAFAKGQLLEITDTSLCNGSYCTPTQEDVLRANLYLYTTCPDLRQPLVGGSHVMTPSADGSCLKHVGAGGVPPVTPLKPPCPQLTAAAKAGLEGLCAGDFNNREAQVQANIETWLGGGSGGACVYLCAFGRAQRGQSDKELEGILVDYGDTVAAIVSMNIVDGRAVSLQTCARVAGKINGMFSLEVVRGRAAQSFP